MQALSPDFHKRLRDLQVRLEETQQLLDELDAYRLLGRPHAPDPAWLESAGLVKLNSAGQVIWCAPGRLTLFDLAGGQRETADDALWRAAGRWAHTMGYSILPIPPSPQRPLYGLGALNARGEALAILCKGANGSFTQAIDALPFFGAEVFGAPGPGQTLRYAVAHYVGDPAARHLRHSGPYGAEFIALDAIVLSHQAVPDDDLDRFVMLRALILDKSHAEVWPLLQRMLAAVDLEIQAGTWPLHRPLMPIPVVEDLNRRAAAFKRVMGLLGVTSDEVLRKLGW